MTTRIIRAARRYRYAQIDIRAIEDTRLSWAARGLLIYVLSRPDDWRVIARHLARQGDLRRDGIYRLLRELRTCGYVRLVRRRNDEGTFAGADYYVREIAENAPPRPILPDSVEPDTAIPGPVKP